MLAALCAMPASACMGASGAVNKKTRFQFRVGIEFPYAFADGLPWNPKDLPG
jgi:hypothetical protein